ncbi:unnamed protein product [marine sediment metagenome]|uniref:Uncharacterized protein n=1 Tax=marine sediment metagenome TaxID=412755 RepID=X0VJL7_9ZZZZ
MTETLIQILAFPIQHETWGVIQVYLWVWACTLIPLCFVWGMSLLVRGWWSAYREVHTGVSETERLKCENAALRAKFYVTTADGFRKQHPID